MVSVTKDDITRRHSLVNVLTQQCSGMFNTARVWPIANYWLHNCIEWI